MMAAPARPRRTTPPTAKIGKFESDPPPAPAAAIADGTSVEVVVVGGIVVVVVVDVVVEVVVGGWVVVVSGMVVVVVVVSEMVVVVVVVVGGWVVVVVEVVDVVVGGCVVDVVVVVGGAALTVSVNDFVLTRSVNVYEYEPGGVELGTWNRKVKLGLDPVRPTAIPGPPGVGATATLFAVSVVIVTARALPAVTEAPPGPLIAARAVGTEPGVTMSPIASTSTAIADAMRWNANMYDDSDRMVLAPSRYIPHGAGPRCAFKRECGLVLA